MSSDNLDAVKCQEPKPPSLRSGDLDCDGEVGSNDALVLLLHLAGFPFEQFGCPPVGSGAADDIVGDADCDDGVTVDDLLLLPLSIGGLPINLAVGCPPIGVP